MVHPNNPTGHFTKPWEAEELARICREYQLSLIVDEVFLDYGIRSDDARSRSRLCLRGLEGVPVFVVSGLSKIAGLPQMKAAWIVATGPESRQALDRLEVIADTFLSMNAPVQWALPAWLSRRRQIQEQIRQRVAANLAELDRQLAGCRFWNGWRRGRLVCGAAHSGAGAGRADRSGASGARRLGPSRLLFRDAGVGLAGGEPAGTELEFSIGVTL